MSNKQALRELHERVATLLQQANSESGPSAAWLGVRLGGRKLLLPLQQSGEIYAMTPIQPLPYSKPWFLGVAPLRGNIHGVVELGAFMPDAPANAQSAEPGKPCLVGLNDDFGVNVVFRVDGLEGLRSREAFMRSEAPAEGAPAHLGSTFFDGNDTAWQEVNLQALTQDPQFLDIAADMASVTSPCTHQAALGTKHRLP
ncbi:MAG: chemotaxis protein CheW [Brachymonas sp.]|nr:chemotaxis protein CheW [Brachymonas sp.]